MSTQRSKRDREGKHRPSHKGGRSLLRSKSARRNHNQRTKKLIEKLEDEVVSKLDMEGD